MSKKTHLMASKNYKITKIIAREILDSRGFPTVEADVFLNDLHINKDKQPNISSQEILNYFNVSA